MYERLLQESLYMIDDGCSFEEAHIRLFENLRSRRDFFTKAFRSQDYNSVYGYGNRSIAQYYIDLIPRKTGVSLNDDEILQVRLFTAGTAFLTTEWACDGMRTEPQALAHAFAMSAPSPFDCVNPLD
ncbi:TetR-like C-terminal domain-containing protein [Slackia heliotrinireducens]|uniref:TetR-like C-terminal domain-containing protein n=1 Tax=Slackia heliotrinireducens TaxID=84110 RepID=UPI0033147573